MALIHVKNTDEFKTQYVRVMADWDKWRCSNFFFFKIEDPDVLLHVEVFPKNKETHASFISFKDNDAVRGLILRDSDFKSEEPVSEITPERDAEMIVDFLGKWMSQLEIFGGEEGLKAENARRREKIRQAVAQARNAKK